MLRNDRDPTLFSLHQDGLRLYEPLDSAEEMRRRIGVSVDLLAEVWLAGQAVDPEEDNPDLYIFRHAPGTTEQVGLREKPFRQGAAVGTLFEVVSGRTFDQRWRERLLGEEVNPQMMDSAFLDPKTEGLTAGRRLIIGRAAAFQHILNDAYISRRHAYLLAAPPSPAVFEIQDASMYGTVVQAAAGSLVVPLNVERS